MSRGAGYISQSIGKISKHYSNSSSRVSKTWLPSSHDSRFSVPSQQPPDLQIELCALQSHPSFQAKRNEPAISFWKLVPRDPVSRSQGFPLQACLEAHIYVRRLFHYETHQIKIEKHDDNLFHLMQIALTNIEIDIPRIVCNSRSHSWLI